MLLKTGFSFDKIEVSDETDRFLLLFVSAAAALTSAYCNSNFLTSSFEVFASVVL